MRLTWMILIFVHPLQEKAKDAETKDEEMPEARLVCNTCYMLVIDFDIVLGSWTLKGRDKEVKKKWRSINNYTSLTEIQNNLIVNSQLEKPSPSLLFAFSCSRTFRTNTLPLYLFRQKNLKNFQLLPTIVKVVHGRLPLLETTQTCIYPRGESSFRVSTKCVSFCTSTFTRWNDMGWKSQ